jgi:hypothetical protein
MFWSLPSSRIVRTCAVVAAEPGWYVPAGWPIGIRAKTAIRAKKPAKRVQFGLPDAQRTVQKNIFRFR